MFAIGSQAELTRGRAAIPLGYKIDVMRGAVKSFALVLATVNAPYSQQLTAQELADCLIDHDKAKAMPGHMSSFFGEVAPELQIDFASRFNITKAQLVAAARAFALYSGETYPIAA
jgi:hypothetical protein